MTPQVAHVIVGYSLSSDRASLAMAERICRAAHRISGGNISGKRCVRWARAARPLRRIILDYSPLQIPNGEV